MLSQKVSLFTVYLRKFHVSYFISESCVLQVILTFSIVFVNHVSTHRHATVFVNNVFFPQQQTNRHLGARPTQIEDAAKFNKHKAIRQNT